MKKILMAPLFCAVLALASAPGLVTAKGKGDDEYHGKGHEKHEQKAKSKKHGKEHGGKGENGRKHKAAGRTIIIEQDKRTIIQQYYDTTYLRQGNCPPGLAKKDNGCMPPGQAKKVWTMHEPLPPHIVPVPLPIELIHRLGPPPRGYAYGYVDGEILLYSTVGKVVVDSILSIFQ